MSKENLEEANKLNQLAKKLDYHEDQENRYAERAGNAEERALKAWSNKNMFDYEWHNKNMEKNDHLAKRHGQAASIAAKLIKKMAERKTKKL